MKKVIMFLVMIVLATSVVAQSLTLPPQAGNQRTFIKQSVGIVNVSIGYGSPDVNGREGKIWGQLVPYDNGKPLPWRAGANENTVMTFSKGVKIQGQPLSAGSYGFHIIPSEDEWILIFSKDYTNWGSFAYNQKNDALRVTARPERSEFNEYLTYEFSGRTNKEVTIELKWENLKVAFRIEVDFEKVMLESIRADLKGAAGAGPLSWKSWSDAATFSLNNGFDNYEEALRWANISIGFNPFFGNVITKHQLLEKLDRTAESEKAFELAMSLGSNEDLYRYGRLLIIRNQYESALKVMKANEKKFDQLWPVNLGLGRAYLAKSDKKNALKYLGKALNQASSNRQKTIIKGLMEQARK